MRIAILFALAIAAVAMGGWSWHYGQEEISAELTPGKSRSMSATSIRERDQRVEVARGLSAKLAWEATAAGGLAVVLGVYWFISTWMGLVERIVLIIAMLIAAGVPAALLYRGLLPL